MISLPSPRAGRGNTVDNGGSVYYGRRYYDPGKGRFVGRDPKGESGGIHLYAFVTNDPTNRWDYLGMDGGAGVAFSVGGLLGTFVRGTGLNGSGGIGGFSGNQGSVAPNFGAYALGSLGGRTVGAGGGAGLGLFFTNANSANQINGRFTTFTYYVPGANIIFARNATGVWVTTVTVGKIIAIGGSITPAGEAAGATIGSLNTNPYTNGVYDSLTNETREAPTRDGLMGAPEVIMPRVTVTPGNSGKPVVDDGSAGTPPTNAGGKKAKEEDEEDEDEVD